MRTLLGDGFPHYCSILGYIGALYLLVTPGPLATPARCCAGWRRFRSPPAVDRAARVVIRLADANERATITPAIVGRDRGRRSAAPSWLRRSGHWAGYILAEPARRWPTFVVAQQ